MFVEDSDYERTGSLLHELFEVVLVESHDVIRVKRLSVFDYVFLVSDFLNVKVD